MMMTSLSSLSSSINIDDDNAKNNYSSFDDDDDNISCSSRSSSEMNNPSIMPSSKLLSISSGFPSIANNVEVLEGENNN